MKKDWSIKKLNEIGKIVSGATPKSKIIEYWDGDIAWITPKDLGELGNKIYIEETSRKISELGLKSCSTNLMPKGAIIMSSRAPIGHLGISTTEICTNQGCKSIVPNEDMVSEYIYYYLLHSKSNLNKLGTGAVFPEISIKVFGDFKIPVPPLEEQQKIVEKLDKAFELLDQAKANIEKNIQNAKELFQSKLDEVFSLKNGKLYKLGDLGKITSSKRIYKSEYVDEGIPFYRTKEIKELSNSENISLELFITIEKYNEIKEKFGVPKAGDILISAVGTIGEIYVVKENDRFYFKDGNIIWLKDFNVNSNYLSYLLKSIVSEVKKLAKGAAYSALTIEKLVNVEVNLPSTENEQIKIVKILDEILLKSRMLEDMYQQKLSNIEELRKSILEKAFKGELTN